MKRSGPIQRKTPLRSGGNLKRTPLNQQSAKRRKIQGERSKMVRQQLEARPWCEAGPVIYKHEVDTLGIALVRARGRNYTGQCTNRAVDIHEPLQRSHGGSIVDPENTISLCRRCHDWIHNHPKESIVLGLLRSAYGDE